MASKKQTPAVTPEAESFRITIQLGSDTLKGQGSTALEALQSLQKPDKIVAKAILTMEQGKLKTSRLFSPQHLNRIFYASSKFQEIHAKQLWTGVK